MSLLTHNLLSKHPTELDKVLDLFGYTSFINHFAFVPFSLISLLGLIGNIIGVLATHRLVNECPTYGIYRILRVYCLNSSIACFLFMFTFIGYSIFYFPWIMSEQAASFMILIYIPMSNLGYFYSSALDILMTLERVCVLKGRTQLVRMDRINSFCLITLLVLLIIEIPFFLRYEPASLTIRIESKSVNGSLSHDESSIRWWYVGFTSFSLSRVGNYYVKHYLTKWTVFVNLRKGLGNSRRYFQRRGLYSLGNLAQHDLHLLFENLQWTKEATNFKRSEPWWV